MRRLFTNNMAQGLSKRFTREAKAVVPHRAQKNLTQNWLNRLRSSSHSVQAMDQHSQLQALLDYYNRNVEDLKEKNPIDWDDAKENVHTEGVIDKIKEQYDAFMATQYSVDEAVDRALAKSKQLKLLDIKNDYNFEIWWYNFIMNLDTLEAFQAVGDASQLSMQEMINYHEYRANMQQGEFETGNIEMPFVDEENLYPRLVAQFSWASRLQVPFNHSSEVTSAVGTTLGKLGR